MQTVPCLIVVVETHSSLRGGDGDDKEYTAI
jgi:hypothetical protein